MFTLHGLTTRSLTGRLVAGAASLAALTLAGVLLAPAAAPAATATQNLTIGATVAARATLTLGATAINFPDADPDAVPSIPATENPVSVTARVRTASTNTPTLTVLASGDLTSGTDTIPISNVSWTAGGAPFINGTMSATTAQSAASFPAGSGQYSSSFSYFLVNSWSYNVGSYTASVTYTLTAP
ncbi:MAG TPA: hypothetical protein VNM66_00775 [Thermodesulfobacteriota bacterium]|nr:hypothetical protein [Thermodesulfobacteriota bacterium]